MLDKILTVLIGLVGGFSVGFQAPIVGAMSQRIGGAASSFIVHVGGSIVAGILLLARHGEKIGEWRGLPWYMLASGAFGVILYLTLTRTLPELGAGVSVTLIIVGQLFVGMAIDHFGWFDLPVRPMDPARIVAAVLLLIGSYIMVSR
ncbi:MAG: bacterial/archaeal transporter family-2 protein [Chloroflexia bacterium]|jgi:transporter family-2 protein|nr:bacterial/archaeal transporter family-2 protein [Chloroflexia bacterium]